MNISVATPICTSKIGRIIVAVEILTGYEHPITNGDEVFIKDIYNSTGITALDGDHTL